MMNQDYFNDPFACVPEEIPPPTDADAPPEDPYQDPRRYRVPPDVPKQATATLVHEEIPPPTDADVPPFDPDDPIWVIHKKTGDDICAGTFVECFARMHDIRYMGGRFYKGEETIAEDALKKMIYTAIKPFVKISANRVTAIMALLAIETECPAPEVKPNCIYFKNCTLALTPRVSAQGAASAVTGAGAANVASVAHVAETYIETLPPEPVCLCRVPHDLDPNAGEPIRFLTFLFDLFYAADIQTLQEYLGYCLLPNTKAQKALFIIGKGGEGKSRLTKLMKLVLGKACVISSISRIGEKFFGTALEHRLLFIDDDLCCDKFHATDAFKTLVTNENEVTVEPKGKAFYESCHYARFLLMGNQSVGSLHDRSEGFYRRVHIINTKPRNKNRTHNPNIIEEIWEAEQDAILLWLVRGALFLAQHNYQLTESDASRAELKALRQSDNTALEFLQEQRFVYGEGCSVTSQQLTAKYREWCFDNDLFKMGGAAFKQTCDTYFEGKDVIYSKTITTGLGTARGYRGVGYAY